MKEVNLKWVDSNYMVGVDQNGNSITMGTRKGVEPEWKGMNPSTLLLLSAASCSSYDVINILEKQREPMKDLEVKVTGSQLDQPPYNFTEIHLHYKVTGDVKAEKVKKAIELSQNKYCSVINSLNDKVKVTFDFEIID